ncbi:DUF6093 family protein [Phytoactinopolyspora limicola]|uniref:DUF6093 family protein n=1 Tax=Phytoactinopolyspora limicola TaxID=2715536 RepID=UPI00140BE0FA|nr:DUF6093 family protein [Phytoactinopolyspora limicola]
MPRPGTPIIPPGALEMHRAVSSNPRTMPYLVRVRHRPVKGELNEATGEYPETPGAVTYDGRARLHPVSLNEQQYAQIEVAQQKSRWWLRLPLGAEVAENLIVEVYGIVEGAEDVADEALIGRVFRILDDTPRTFGTELRVTVREEPVPRADPGGSP